MRDSLLCKLKRILMESLIYGIIIFLASRNELLPINLYHIFADGKLFSLHLSWLFSGDTRLALV